MNIVVTIAMHGRDIGIYIKEKITISQGWSFKNNRQNNCNMVGSGKQGDKNTKNPSQQIKEWRKLRQTQQSTGRRYIQF